MSGCGGRTRYRRRRRLASGFGSWTRPPPVRNHGSMRGASFGAMRRAGTSRRAMVERRRAWPLAALLALLALVAAGCGRSEGGPGAGEDAGGGPGTPGAPALANAEAETLRARSEAQFAENNFEQAYEILQPLLARPEPALEDFVRGGVLLLARDRTDEAAALVERASS